jgi:hypothetical protein
MSKHKKTLRRRSRGKKRSRTQRRGRQRGGEEIQLILEKG